MQAIWTLDGDETSWTAWAEGMAQAPASPLTQELLTGKKAPAQGWAVDVGCGTGRAFLPLAEAGYRVVGLDPTVRALVLSRQRALESHLGAYPVQASAARLPLQTASVSLVFAIGTLFHLSMIELRDALQEIRRVLHADGEAFLHFLDMGDWRHSLGREICPDEAPELSYRAVVTCFCSREAVKEWIEAAGLRLLSMELRTSESQAGQQRNWLVKCRP